MGRKISKTTFSSIIMKKYYHYLLIVMALSFASCKDDECSPTVNSNFSASKMEILEGESITFTDQSTGNPSSWDWSFRGANTNTSSDQNPSVLYDQGGIYDVYLIASNGGNSDVELKEDFITVLQEIEADFTFSDSVINESEGIEFSDRSEGIPSSWSWTFDGGSPTSSTDANVEVNYAVPGVYDVSLTASNSLSSSTIAKEQKIVIIPTTNLVAFFPFNEGTLDASLNEMNGSTVGNTSRTNDRFQVPNMAYEFDGNGDYIDCGSDNRNIIGELTLSAWVKTSSYKAQHIVSKTDYTVLAGYSLSMSDGKVRFSGHDGSGSFRTTEFSSPINDDNWHHVVGICNFNIWQIWVDGILVDTFDSGYTTGDLRTDIPLTIGYFYVGEGSDHRDFNGTIDNVRVYNRSLKENEILALSKDDQ